MNMSTLYTTSDLVAPLRSEAFYEDLSDARGGEDSSHDEAIPWTLRQAGLAALLCLMPAVFVAGLVSLPALGV